MKEESLHKNLTFKVAITHMNRILLFICVLLSMQIVHAQTSISRQVAATTDDAEQNIYSGGMDRSSSDLELSYDGDRDRYQRVGLRFTSISIPQGAVITNASISFRSNQSKSGAVTLSIKGQNVNNAVTFSSSDNDITNRTLTTATATWSPSSWSSGTWYATSDISTVVQEIVNRSGWSSNNSMVFVIWDNSSGSSYRSAYSYDESASSAPF